MIHRKFLKEILPLPISLFLPIHPASPVLVFLYPPETGFARFQPMDSRFRRKNEGEAAEPATQQLALVTSVWCQVQNSEDDLVPSSMIGII